MRTISASIAMVLVLGCAADQPDEAPVEDGLDRLAQDSREPVTITTDANGQPVDIIVEVPVPLRLSDPVERADWFLGQYGSAVGIDDPVNQLEVYRVTETEDGDAFVRYRRLVNGVPVWASYLTVAVGDNGVVTGTTGHLPPLDALQLGDAMPTVSEAEARQIAESAEPGHRTVESELVVLSPGLIDELPYDGALVWRVDLTESPLSIDPPTRFVSATDGSLHWFRSTRGRQALNREVWNITCSAGAAVETIIYRESDSAAAANSSRESARAFRHFGTVHAYWQNTHGRDSFDGQGAKIQAFVNFQLPDCSATTFASWTGGKFVFSPGTPTLDVIAHEFTHAVIEHTADLSGSGRPGALGESLSDTFAYFVDQNWVAGEGLPMRVDLTQPRTIANFRGYPTRSGMCLRNQDCQRTACTDATGACLRADCTDFTCSGGRCIPLAGACNDKGFTHENGRIPTYAAYLAITGGPNPIGRQKAEKIYYFALDHLMGPSTNFLLMRTALRRAALHLAENRKHGITHRDCGSILNAWEAIGIGAGDQDNDCFDDLNDTCPNVYNPDQTQDTCECQGAACAPASGCNMEGAPCSGSGRAFDGECCGDLICVVGRCQPAGGRREGAACEDTECAPGLACREVMGSNLIGQCCARDSDYCSSKADCCGHMECTDNRCVGRQNGESCILGDCVGGSFCDSNSNQCM
ncbi:MAG: M4 family metallopeptidase [Myxococcota bacterium]